MSHLLLIRLSALGDALMTIPIVDALARQNPALPITMAGPPALSDIFRRLPANVHYLPVNKGHYSGPLGLWRLYRQLAALRPTHVCDLHDVIRTKVVRFLFALAGKSTAHICKDRPARRRFLSERPPVQQVTSFERYRQALVQMGFEVDFSHFSPLATYKVKEGGIGIAPFAAHPGKAYPLTKMEEVVRILSAQGRKIYIFGAGCKERTMAERWATNYAGVESTIGRLGGMDKELDFIAGLDVMVSMDSANMHLASLTSTPVVSIWGATHPYGGFLGWGQDLHNVLQMDDMPCRPCSIYGKTLCPLGDYPCLSRITPERIVDKVNELCE